jgi:hypothetical protein
MSQADWSNVNLIRTESIHYIQPFGWIPSTLSEVTQLKWNDLLLPPVHRQKRCIYFLKNCIRFEKFRLIYFDTKQTEYKKTPPTIFHFCENVFAELLPSIKWRIHRHRDSWDGFMKLSVVTGSGAVTNIPSFIKIG